MRLRKLLLVSLIGASLSPIVGHATTSGVEPVNGSTLGYVIGDGTNECKSILGAGYFGYKFDSGNWNLRTATAVGIAGNDLKVTSTDATNFQWESTFGIDAVIAKGGSGANIYRYDPPAEATSDGGLRPPVNSSGSAAGISHITFCFDYEVNVSKTAATALTRTYDWTIDKSVSPAEHSLLAGGSAASSYAVAAKRTATDSNWAVTGKITVENHTPYPAKIAALTDVITTEEHSEVGVAVMEYPPAKVTCENPLPYSLPVHGTLNCTYNQSLEGGADGSNSVVVDTVVTAQEPVKGNTAHADVTFAAAKVTEKGYPTVNVNDDKAGTLGTAGADGGNFAYKKTFECPTDAAKYTNGVYTYTVDNIATIKETSQNDSAKVTVKCELSPPPSSCDPKNPPVGGCPEKPKPVCDPNAPPTAKCPAPTPSCSIGPGDFRTQTQGGWGTSCKGGNPGCYRDEHFASVFASGLTIGEGNNKATFTTSKAIDDFLSAGGTAGVLKGSVTNPTKTSAGILAGQVTALTLSVNFDKADATFGKSETPLADLIAKAGTCAGMTVGEILAEANKVLAGSGKLTPSQINDCVAAINENFVDGTEVKDSLKLPASACPASELPPGCTLEADGSFSCVSTDPPSVEIPPGCTLHADGSFSCVSVDPPSVEIPPGCTLHADGSFSCVSTDPPSVEIPPGCTLHEDGSFSCVSVDPPSVEIPPGCTLHADGSFSCVSVDPPVVVSDGCTLHEDGSISCVSTDPPSVEEPTKGIPGDDEEEPADPADDDTEIGDSPLLDASDKPTITLPAIKVIMPVLPLPEFGTIVNPPEGQCAQLVFAFKMKMKFNSKTGDLEVVKAEQLPSLPAEVDATFDVSTGVLRIPELPSNEAGGMMVYEGSLKATGTSKFKVLRETVKGHKKVPKKN